MANFRTCTHIKVTGVRCGSPALRGEQYCYFHYRMLCDSRISHVALLENEEAIQVSLMEIVNSLLRGTIDVKRGELVLRALNTAVRNIRRARFENPLGMIRELPDPVVQPRPKQYSHEEIDKMKKEMLAEYYKSKQQDAGTKTSPSSTSNVATSGSAPSTKNVVADPRPRLPRAESSVPAQSVPDSRAGKTSVDPTQRKPPAAVKKLAAPQERKNAAHGLP